MIHAELIWEAYKHKTLTENGVIISWICVVSGPMTDGMSDRAFSNNIILHSAADIISDTQIFKECCM